MFPLTFPDCIHLRIWISYSIFFSQLLIFLAVRADLKVKGSSKSIPAHTLTCYIHILNALPVLSEVAYFAEQRNFSPQSAWK
jgi:hypothetical protein